MLIVLCSLVMTIMTIALILIACGTVIYSALTMKKITKLHGEILILSDQLYRYRYGDDSIRQAEELLRQNKELLSSHIEYARHLDPEVNYYLSKTKDIREKITAINKAVDQRIMQRIAGYRSNPISGSLFDVAQAVRADYALVVAEHQDATNKLAEAEKLCDDYRDCLNRLNMIIAVSVATACNEGN